MQAEQLLLCEASTKKPLGHGSQVVLPDWLAKKPAAQAMHAPRASLVKPARHVHTTVSMRPTPPGHAVPSCMKEEEEGHALHAVH